MPRRATLTKRTSDGRAGPSARLSPVVEDGAGADVELELSPKPKRPVMRAPPPPQPPLSQSEKARSPPWYKRRPAFLRLMEESLSA